MGDLSHVQWMDSESPDRVPRVTQLLCGVSQDDPSDVPPTPFLIPGPHGHLSLVTQLLLLEVDWQGESGSSYFNSD